MKKSMIALAVLGAFAGAASAQSSITLYGIAEPTLQLGFSSETTNKLTNAVTKTSAGARIVDGNDGGVGASRFGLRGREDLGAGLAAIFNLEAALQINNGAAEQSGGGAFFGRTATAGLAGSFGTLQFGKFVTPMWGLQAGTEVQGAASGVADAWAYLAAPGGSVANAAGSGINGTARVANAFRYDTPDMSGFGASLYYGTGGGKQDAAGVSSLIATTGAGPNSAAQTFGPSCGSSCNGNKGGGIVGSYANGPLFVGIGFENAISVDTAGPAPQKNQYKLSAIGASYDFGVVKLLGNYSQKKFDNSGTAISSGTAKLYSLSLSAPLGAGTGYINFAKGKNDGTVSTPTASSSKGDGKAASIGYNYPLSKRTTIVTTYGQGNITADGFNAAGVTTASGEQKDRSAAIGLRHTF